MAMRERIARGILVVWQSRVSSHLNLIKPDFDQCTPETRDMCFTFADAALDALLNPTDGMLKELHNDIHPNWLAEKAYLSMIRAAKEGK
jgi:hypothetical protein